MTDRMNIRRDKSCCCFAIQPSSLQEQVMSDYSFVIPCTRTVVSGLVIIPDVDPGEVGVTGR